MMKKRAFRSGSSWSDMEPEFLIQYPSHKELDSCLVSASKVLVGSAKTLQGSNPMLRLQAQALSLAKKSGRCCVECRKLPEGKAIPKLIRQLGQLRDSLACIARRMPTSSISDRKLRYLVLRTAEEVGEYVGRGAVSLR